MSTTPVPDVTADRRLGCHNRPVQTSAVYLLNTPPHFSAEPPPSPPSPPTPPEEDGLCNPIEELSLDSPLPPPALSSPASHPQPAGTCSTTTSSSTSSSSSSSSCPLVPDNTITATTTFNNASTASAQSSRLSTAVHVLTTEAAAVAAAAALYASQPAAREAFDRAVEAVTRAALGHGKLVLCGVGKSGLIARKLAATFTSLSVPAAFLHPTEALHGDLGLVGPRDVLLLLSYSGRTAELASLLPHVPPGLAVVLVTGADAGCDVARARPGVIVLPAPVVEDERLSFGVAAPTTSTTVALAVGDALAVVVAREVHRGGGPAAVARVFELNHPGGAIGAAAAATNPRPVVVVAATPPCRREVRQLAVSWAAMTVLGSCGGAALCGADVLRAAYASVDGWVRVGTAGVVAPSRIRALSSTDLTRPLADLPGLVVGRLEFVGMAADTKVRSAADWIRGVRALEGEGEGVGCDIIAVLEHGDIVGVLEVDRLLEASEAVV